MSNIDRYFEGTCESVDLANCEGNTYLDACNCQNYFQCSNKAIITLACSEDTLWDHEQHICDHAKNVVFKYPCDADNAWQRCNVSETRLQHLGYFCTNATTSSTTSTTTVLPNTTAPSGGVNAGIVIGLIAAGAVIALILIALCVLYRRRQKRLSQIQKGRPSVQNPEYFEGGNKDDPYAVIDDTMHDPTYNASMGGTTMARSNGTLPPIPPDMDFEENVEYDNSAFKGDTPFGNGGYTDTLRRSVREYETPINVSATHSLNSDSSKTDEHRPTNPMDENGNKN